MEELRCKNCDAELDLSLAQGGVVTCEFCGSKFTLPKEEQTEEVLSYLRMGQNELNCCAFERAYTAFSKAADLDPQEPEAFFGMALAEFRVQYLKDISADEKTGKIKKRLQPICHGIDERSILQDRNFRKACSLATSEQREEYTRRAEEIDYIKKEFFNLSRSGLTYDCFLCVKVSDEQGGQTQDCYAATKLYSALKSAGYKPFFSEFEIKNRTGADYEAMILYALYRAHCMLVVCSNPAYLQTPWVKNEYTRFISLMNEREKESDSVAFVYRGTPVERLPNVRGKLQGIDFTDFDALDRVKEFIDRHDPAKQRAQAESALIKEEQEADRRKDEADEATLQAERKAEEAAKKAAELERRFNELLAKSTAATPAPEPVPARTPAPMPAPRPAPERKPAPIPAPAPSRAEPPVPPKPAAAPTPAKDKPVQDKPTQIKSGGSSAATPVQPKPATKPVTVQQAKPASQNGYDEEGFKVVNGELVAYREPWYHASSTVYTLYIPKGVIKIAPNLFKRNKKIYEIVIPEGVKEIGDMAFAGCINLEEIVLPAGIEKIGKFAFHRSCNSSVIKPADVKLLRIYCADKKPLFGIHKGWDRQWRDKLRGFIKWGCTGAPKKK